MYGDRALLVDQLGALSRLHLEDRDHPCDGHEVFVGAAPVHATEIAGALFEIDLEVDHAPA